ncbi:hypothetical protein BJ986_000215 [Phycicoccus badiiscoriae]|uniref:Uncharacterized protein n=1 Tax=Pedococcus badiiscoriae TaxID=642776 RepID=A0A852W9H7_9MICO|nr:hypothetical protein [Pedococcus badiiscoriae]
MTPPKEVRPGAGAGPTHEDSVADLYLDSRVIDLDAIHHAWIVGFRQGYDLGRQHASEDMARALLHEQAAVMAGTAVATATANHGPGWASAIRQQAEAVGS